MHFCCKILDIVMWVLVSSIGKIPCLLLIKKKKKKIPCLQIRDLGFKP